MANAGQQIGGAIQNYFQKKEEKKQQELTYNTLLPYVQENLGAGKDAENIAKMFSKDPAMAQQALQLGMQGREQKAQQNALAAATTVTKEGNKIDTQAAIPAYLELGGSDPEGFGQLLKQFTGNGEIVVDSNGIITQGGKFMGQTSVNRQPSPADIAKQEAELDLIEARTALIKSQQEEASKPKKITPNEMVKMLDTKVGEVSLGDYLQELSQAKEISGGKIHQKGMFNFDENQIAAFDQMIRQYPQLISEGMPQVVKEYYGVKETLGGLTIIKR
jgi:hypothetical protein